MTCPRCFQEADRILFNDMGRWLATEPPKAFGREYVEETI